MWIVSPIAISRSLPGGRGGGTPRHNQPHGFLCRLFTGLIAGSRIYVRHPHLSALFYCKIQTRLSGLTELLPVC